MAWFHARYPAHEGGVVGYVLCEDCPPGFEQYRELACAVDFSSGAGAAARPAERIAAGCTCGWRSPHWSPSLPPLTVGPLWVTAFQDEQKRAHQLWERHLVLDVGDRRMGAGVGQPAGDGRSDRG